MMWYIYNGILFSHKKNESSPFATIWMDLEYIYAKWNKSEKDKYHMISPIYRIKKKSNLCKTSSYIQRTDQWLGEGGIKSKRGGSNFLNFK